jgi:16S rRNA (adenine1518-N6/adenine1519-N6)-dimethyltransferase
MSFSKKSLGQNFLTDLNIIKKITNQIDIKNKNILEIGPGKGALTDQIVKKNPKSLILIEKDNKLSEELKLKYKNFKNVKIFNKDILKFNLERILLKNSIIFGNLPYNISSQILIKILKFKMWPPKYSALIFMFQKEMAERVIGKFNTSKYGRLSIITNYKLNVFNKFDVSPNCFSPKPKIVSTVLYLKPNKKIFNGIKNIENLEKITRVLFSSKRKMINKNIKKIFKKNELIDLLKKINIKSRPSNLSPENFYEITRVFEGSQ